jgi:hypothetical protein
MMNNASSSRNKSFLKGFVQGSFGAMTGAAASHPFDVIKVRMQIHGEGSITSSKIGMTGMGVDIYRTNGVSGLLSGLSASLFRQFFYSGVRFGVYDILKNASNENPTKISLFQKITMAASAGAIGACVANPGDVAMVRMQADAKLPVEKRRNYKNIFNALRRIAQEEGISRLWRGVVPTMNRAMIVTIGHLAAYDEAKYQIKSAGLLEEGIPLHFSASFTAAFVASLMSHPVDVAKTRLMNMSGGEYNGMVHCLTKTIDTEGVFALYKGFLPTLIRQMPYVIVTWVTVEQIKILLHDI